MIGKKRIKQHRIGDEAVSLFRSSLPKTEEFEMVFTEESRDYGIDGHLQIFINNEHTGEIPQVQIKGNDTGNYIKDGKILSFSMDLNSAFFLIEQTQDPTALIVVDNDKKSVFWYPIQTNLDARESLEKRLIESKAKDPSITVHIDTKKHLLTPNNYRGLYSYFQEARLKLAKKALLRIKTDKTLSEGVKHLNEVERQIYELEGFDRVFRKGNFPTFGAVFSIESSDGKNIDYLPNKSFKPNLVPKVNLKTKFSTKTKDGIEKYKAFRRAVQEGKGSVELSSEYIDSYEMTIGSQIFDTSKSGGKTSISIGPSKTKQVVYLSNGVDELEHQVEIWGEDGAFVIQSLEGQPLYISLKLKMGEMSTKFNFGINSDLMTNASHHLRMLDFICNRKELIISFIDSDGFKRKLFGGEINVPSLVTEDQYRFAKALAEIEQTSGVPIPFPIPDKLTREDVTNIFWVHRIITQGKIVQKVTLSFTLQNKPPEHVEKDKYMSMTKTPPEIYLFEKPYVLPGFIQTISGKITRLETPEGEDKASYKLEMEEAEISIKKENNSDGKNV